MKNPKHRLLLNVFIQLLDIKAYLYRLFDRDFHRITFPPHDPQLYRLGRTWQGKLQSLLPGYPVEFIGSTALQIPGQRDLDFAVVCHQTAFNLVLPVLSQIFGEPKQINGKFYTWHFLKKDINFDVCLIDPRDPFYRHLVTCFYLMKNDQNLLHAYRTLKQNFSGKASNDFNYARNKLFNRIAYLERLEV